MSMPNEHTLKPYMMLPCFQGCGLCHGISGNTYAFLSLYRITKDELYLRRASDFGTFMVKHWQELAAVPDNLLSLYEVRTGYSYYSAFF